MCQTWQPEVSVRLVPALKRVLRGETLHSSLNLFENVEFESANCEKKLYNAK